MVAAFILALAALPAAASGVSLVADLHASEWDPSPQVEIDVADGAYLYGLPPDRVWRSPAPSPVRRVGRLDAASLSRLQAAYHSAARGGLVDQACIDRRPPGSVVIGGGVNPQSLSVLVDHRLVASTDRDGCFTAAAAALHALLEQLFPRPAQPGLRLPR